MSGKTALFPRNDRPYGWKREVFPTENALMSGRPFSSPAFPGGIAVVELPLLSAALTAALAVSIFLPIRPSLNCGKSRSRERRCRGIVDRMGKRRAPLRGRIFYSRPFVQSLFRRQRFASRILRPVVSRKKRGLSVRFGPGGLTLPRRTPSLTSEIASAGCVISPISGRSRYRAGTISLSAGV